jgi:hypothetical protein
MVSSTGVGGIGVLGRRASRLLVGMCSSGYGIESLFRLGMVHTLGLGCLVQVNFSYQSLSRAFLVRWFLLR